MKRIGIAIAIFIISISACVLEQIYIKDFYSGLDERISIAQKDMSNDSLNDIHEYWNDKNDILFALCQHDMLDDLSVSIHEMHATKDKEKIKSALTNVKAQNRTFYENQKITISNIF